MLHNYGYDFRLFLIAIQYENAALNGPRRFLHVFYILVLLPVIKPRSEKIIRRGSARAASSAMQIFHSREFARFVIVSIQRAMNVCACVKNEIICLLSLNVFPLVRRENTHGCERMHACIGDEAYRFNFQQMLARGLSFTIYYKTR